MLALLLAVMLQSTASPPPVGADIVVQGQRLDIKRERVREINRQIDTILPQVEIDQPLARFQTAVCPGVMGLARASAQAIVDRIGATADELGLAIGPPGCHPNLLIVVAVDADAAVRSLVAKRPGLFDAQSLIDVRRILAEPGSVRGWNNSEIRSRDGERQQMVTWTDSAGFDHDAASLEVRTAGRTALGFRRDILSSFIIIDAAAVRGRDTRQIADYATMRALTGASSRGKRGNYTILSAFTPKDADAPAELTGVDRGVLRALYTGTGNRPAGLKRGEMIRNIIGHDQPDKADAPAR